MHACSGKGLGSCIYHTQLVILFYAGSSGFVSYTAKRTDTPYTLNVTAYDTTTNDPLQTLTADFQIHGHYEDHVCGVNFINTGSSRELNARRDVIEFRSVGGSKYFTIEINNQNISSKWVCVTLIIYYHS